MVTIQRTDDGYLADVGPPHADRDWSTTSPIKLKPLMGMLRELNCHEVDIADALTEADPEWRFRWAVED